jgi:Protein of unknown function (DUF3127).
LVSGQSAKGTWKKQEYILETDAAYPKKICFNAWGDKVDQFNIQEGEELVVSVDLESREFNGRWYTDVRAWKVDRVQAGDPAQSQVPQATAANQPPVEFYNSPADGGNPTDDLPF